MQRKISISIPAPCHENWQKMTPSEKGRFCDACQKQVYDFTKYSDREILQKFNSEKNTCGRFLNSQLERALILPNKKNNFWVAGVSGILSFFSLSQNVYPQEKAATIQTDKKESKSAANSDEEFNISGSIYSGRYMLYGASVENKRTLQKTNSIDGNFTIVGRLGDQLEFTYSDFQSQTITISSKKEIDVFLSKDGINLEEVYTTGLIVIAEKKTFFGRIFRSIGSLFR